MLPTEGFNDLIQRAQAGEPEAIDQLMAVLRPHLEQLARGQAAPTGSRSASDLVQEALLRVWQKLDQFQGTTDDAQTQAMFRSWVGRLFTRLGLNTHRDRHAKRRRPPQKILPLQAGDTTESGVDPPGREPTASTHLRRDEESQRIRAALARLPDETGRAILRLHFFEGESLRQISARLGLSYDKVRELYQAGMHHLEQELGQAP
jgi:RNA polymerase sigma factor (sigma-70 family)